MAEGNICTAIFVPGLGDDVEKLEWATRVWWEGFTPIVFNMHWRDRGHFAPKLKRFLKVVDEAAQRGMVILVGTSAGGSAVGNVFRLRKDKISAAVNVCGRLRRGPHTGYRSFEKMTATSVAFAESVAMFEDHEHELTARDRKKIFTIHPWWDELVPSETTTVEGATNLAIPSVEHVASIALAMTVWSGKIQRSAGT